MADHGSGIKRVLKRMLRRTQSGQGTAYDRRGAAANVKGGLKYKGGAMGGSGLKYKGGRPGE